MAKNSTAKRGNRYTGVRDTYRKILDAETGARASDKRRVLRDERLKLHSALDSGDERSILSHAAECERVLALWSEVA